MVKHTVSCNTFLGDCPLHNAQEQFPIRSSSSSKGGPATTHSAGKLALKLLEQENWFHKSSAQSSATQPVFQPAAHSPLPTPTKSLGTCSLIGWIGRFEPIS